MGRGRVVVAIGGNSLIRDAQHKTVEDQYEAAKDTDHHIAGLVADGWDVAITHGNGPQVGFILRRSELARHELHEVPLDVCGADTQGAIGYMLGQNLINDFRHRGIDRQVAAVVTQVEVDPNDPAFRNPTKPIGSFLTEEEAKRRRDEEGWDVVPVVADENGSLHGVAAVIDKDLASALLASEIEADLLLISTGVEKVALRFGTPEQEWVDRMTLEEAKRYLEEGIHFAEGSMAPKIRAVIKFLEAGGSEALITNPENLERAVAGETGTRIVR